MNVYQQRADEYKEALRRLNEWIAEDHNNWSSLPSEVQDILARGINEYKRCAKESEEMAKRAIK